MPYAIDTIPKSPAGHQLLTQSKKNVLTLATNGEDPTVHPPHPKAHLMNSRVIRLDMDNTKPISVYAERRSTRIQILKRFGPYLIK